MSLTNTAIKNAKSKKKSYKLYDKAGLYIHILHSGGKIWRYKYKFNGLEKLLTIGRYPDIGFSKITPPEKVDAWLPWIHIAIANLKRFLLGTFHGTSKRYLTTLFE